MNYRFVQITTYYRDFLKYYYKKNPGTIGKPYIVQYKEIMDESFGWSNYFQKYLNNLGHEAFEIISNAEPLQKAWAKEHNKNFSGEDVVFEQLKTYNPDIVLFQDIFSVSNSFLQEVKNKVPSIKKIIGWCCSPFTNENLDRFNKFDFILVCSPYFQDLLEPNGIKTYLFPHAFEESLLPYVNIKNNYPLVDFIFIGSLIPSSDHHITRIKILETLLESNIKTEIYANISQIKKHDLILRQAAYIIKELFNSIGLKSINTYMPALRKVSYLNDMPRNVNRKSLILKKYKNPIYGLEMLKALAHAKIAFNKHGEFSGDYSANMRIFESTGVGCCLVTDWKKDLGKFFEIDKEIVTYKSAEECVEKVKWLLANPVEREKIAKAGQLRTLREHNYKNRILLLNEIISNELNRI